MATQTSVVSVLETTDEDSEVVIDFEQLDLIELIVAKAR